MDAPTNGQWDGPARFAIVVLVVVCYVQAIGYEFVQDDHLLIEGHAEQFAAPGATWTMLRFPITTRGAQETVSYYRPVVLLSYLLNFRISGLNPDSYHVLNLLVHLANCLLLFGSVRLLGGGAALAFWTAALFAAHPIHTGSVAWVSGRTDSLALLGMLCAYVAFVKGRQAQTVRRYAWLVLCVCLYLVALLTKEIAVPLPLLLLATDLIVFRARALQGGKMAAALPYVGAVAVALLYLHIRQSMTGTALPPALLSKFASSMPTLRVPALYAFYVKSVLWPGPFKTGPIWPIPGSWGEPLAWLYGLLFGGLVSAFVFIRSAVVRMGLAVFTLATLPVLYTVYPGVGEVTEIWTYIPSVGFSLLAGAGIVRLSVWRLRRVPVGAVLGVVLLASWIPQCWVRNAIHKDEVTFGEYTIKERPDLVFQYINLGTAYSQRGQFDKALACYQEALRRDPKKKTANKNIAAVYLALGDYPRAIEHLNREAALDPGNGLLVVPIAQTYLRMDRVEEAIREYKRALALGPAQVVERLTGVAQAASPPVRVRLLPVVIERAPSYYPAYLALGLAFEQAGKYKEAAEAWRKLLRRFPQTPDRRQIEERIEAALRPRPRPAVAPGASGMGYDLLPGKPGG